MAISTDYFEDLPHAVIVTHASGKVEVREFKDGIEADRFRLCTVANVPGVELMVCVVVKRVVSER